MSGEQCCLCVFWSGPKGKAWDHVVGACRRHAPRRGVSMQYDSLTYREWPETQGREWCGDFTPDSAVSPSGTTETEESEDANV